MRYLRNRAFIFAVVIGTVVSLRGGVASGATFHVSPFGSNTPPYDTYAKAAHKVADAVAYADSGDTVWIGAGSYAVDSTIILRKSFITFQGAGRDSTLILPNSSVEFCFRADGYDYSPDFGFQFSDLTVQGASRYFFWLAGQYKYPSVRESTFRRCHFIGGQICIRILDCPLTVEDCMFDDYSDGVSIWGEGPNVFRNNVFRTQQVSSAVRFSPDGEGPITIDHNTLLAGYGSIFVATDYSTDMVITNNYVDVDWTALYLTGVNIRVANNFIAGATFKSEGTSYVVPEVLDFELYTGDHITFENNLVISHNRKGRVRVFGAPPFQPPGYLRFQYNALWGFRPDSVNVIAMEPDPRRTARIDTLGLVWTDPLLAPDSSGRPQPSSPLIDAGNPAILDSDGSRSDIGLFGGPGGDFRYIDWRAPRTPDSLRGEKHDGSFRLSWKANTELDLAGYRLYINTGVNFVLEQAARIIPIPPESTSFLDTLRPTLGSDGRGYWFYKLTAVDTAGFQSPPTDNMVYWLVDTLPPAAPDSLRGDTTGNGFRLSWKWNSEIDVVGYRVYSDPVEGFLIDHANRVVAVSWNKREFLDTTRLTPGSAARFYKVTAVDKAGLESQPSNEVRWSVAYRPLRAPDAVQGDAVRDGFRLSWRPNPEPYLAGYRVYSDTTPGFLLDHASRAVAVGRDSTTFLDTLRPVSGSRFYRVTAVDSTVLESPPSIEVAWTPSADQGILPREPSIITAYPNPFNSAVVIEYGLPEAGAQPARVAIRVYNLLGQLVKTLYDGVRYPGRYEARWDGRDSSRATVSSGTYFVRLDYWERQAKAYKLVLLK